MCECDFQYLFFCVI